MELLIRKLLILILLLPTSIAFANTPIYTNISTFTNVIQTDKNVSYKNGNFYLHGFSGPGKIEIYPVNTDENQSLFEKYQNMAKEVSNVTFGGRLGQYRYYDMHQVIASALEKVKSLA